MKEIWEKARSLKAAIIADRRYLHQHPEIGLDLPKTCNYIRRRLDEMHIPWKDHVEELPPKLTKDFIEAGFPSMTRATGITATIGHGGPCILLRADMDALPIKEENDLPFASANDYGHMCGHDSHVAMLLGAAAILKSMESKLAGTVKLLFQPGEETGAGARLMVQNGILKDPEVDAALGIHIHSDKPVGEVTYSKGVNSASLDTYIVKIRGRGGHSSAPHQCIDPLMIMNQIYQAVNLLVTRETDPEAMVALTCGVARGGTAVNIIPETAEVHIGVRTLNIEAREHLKKRIPELVDGYVKAWRGMYELTCFATPSTYSDSDFCDQMLPFIREIAGEENVHICPPMKGTEDFGYITQQVPGMYLCLGDGAPGAAPLHNAKMMLREEAFCEGAALYANCAVQWLKLAAGKAADASGTFFRKKSGEDCGLHEKNGCGQEE